MKTVFYTSFLFILISNIIASEYNLDAITKAKGENTSQKDIDNKIVKDADKAYDSVSKRYYYKYTLPAQRAAQARRERLDREETVFSTESSSSSSRPPKNGNNTYRCTYVCSHGIGKSKSKEFSLSLSASNDSSANKTGYNQAKKSCKYMVYFDVHSRWWKGSIDCKRN